MKTPSRSTQGVERSQPWAQLIPLLSGLSGQGRCSGEPKGQLASPGGAELTWMSSLPRGAESELATLLTARPSTQETKV